MRSSPCRPIFRNYVLHQNQRATPTTEGNPAVRVRPRTVGLKHERRGSARAKRQSVTQPCLDNLPLREFWLATTPSTAALQHSGARPIAALYPSSSSM